MPIIYDKNQQIFHLQSKDMSYVIGLSNDVYLTHLYWGKRINTYKGSRAFIRKDRGFAPNPNINERDFSLDTLPQEYPQYGNGDYRRCAYGVKNQKGSRISNLLYCDYTIMQGKQKLDGLPSTFASQQDVNTLVVHMVDDVLHLHVYLSYSVFENENVIVRSVKFENHSEEAITLTKMLSMSLDIRESDFDVITLYGAHNNERNIDRRTLHSGIVEIESLRGTSSPHQAPFMALVRKDTTEDVGEVYASNFVYSGNFEAVAQVDAYGNTRFQMGMNPTNGDWLLKPHTTFQTPEVVMVYANKGLNEMSHTYHNFYQKHLIRSQYVNQVRPVVFNSWEGMFFELDEDKLLSIAKKAKEIGTELFVLDDGWFGHRDADNSSLGDWFVDTRKLPHGLAHLSNQIHEMGMQFGLWFEPEMISIDSELYKQHPDYVLHSEGRPYTYCRSQLVLDLSRKEVVDTIVEQVSKVLEEVNIDYVKWDMNRHLTEVESQAYPYDQQGEIFHRYVLGLYDMMERITTKFPNVLFESCSSGGGRFDPGMLYYMPQTWCSDNTDAVCRMKIQYATTLTYPPITIGAHISDIPNQQTGRFTPLDTRAYVAMSANMGCEMNLMHCSKDELEQLRYYIQQYKEIRETIQFGTFYRITSPFEDNICQWNFVSKDENEVIAFHYVVLSQPAAHIQLLKLKGLDENAMYRNIETGEIFGGDELMYSGISIPIKKQDFRSVYFRFQKVN